MVERVGPQVSLCPPGQNSGISNTLPGSSQPSPPVRPSTAHPTTTTAHAPPHTLQPPDPTHIHAIRTRLASPLTHCTPYQPRPTHTHPPPTPPAPPPTPPTPPPPHTPPTLPAPTRPRRDHGTPPDPCPPPHPPTTTTAETTFGRNKSVMGAEIPTHPHFMCMPCHELL